MEPAAGRHPGEEHKPSNFPCTHNTGFYIQVFVQDVACQCALLAHSLPETRLIYVSPLQALPPALDGVSSMSQEAQQQAIAALADCDALGGRQLAVVGCHNALSVHVMK